MIAPDPLTALAAEAACLETVLTGLAAADWDRPTRCTPWDTAALAAHLTMALARLGPRLDAPEPAVATVDAGGYYRPDERFSQAVNDTRIDSAVRAAETAGTTLPAEFTRTWREAAGRCRAEPPTRRVTTRHGDPMLLADFLTTRVVEVAVHGIDLADALDRPRWTTPEAAQVVVELLLGPDHAKSLAALGWERVTFIAKATGRDPLTDTERAAAGARGVTWLALG
ncbi:MAG TPA: maleylpyruvate isomerase N-terminal domain-containing protein [Glycomyces sp.]|nr:maleylpyruvate isomerase N-terminal domain-containing protein [Glycomyces sp.]